MDESIRTRMDDTRRTLFEHFDEDVHQRLRLQLDDAKAQLDRFGQRFWSLTRFLLYGGGEERGQFLYRLWSCKASRSRTRKAGEHPPALPGQLPTWRPLGSSPTLQPDVDKPCSQPSF